MWMRRLICTFVVRIWHKQIFSWRGSISCCLLFPDEDESSLYSPVFYSPLCVHYWTLSVCSGEIFWHIYATVQMFINVPRQTSASQHRFLWLLCSSPAAHRKLLQICVWTHRFLDVPKNLYTVYSERRRGIKWAMSWDYGTFRPP